MRAVWAIAFAALAACRPTATATAPTTAPPSGRGETQCSPYAYDMAVAAGWVATASRDGLHVTDRATGAVRRIADHNAIKEANVDGIVVAREGGQGAPYKVQGVDIATGAIAWSRSSPHVEATVAGNLLVVAYDDDADCSDDDCDEHRRTNIEAFTAGRKLRWRASVGGKSVGVVAHGGTVYVATSRDSQATLHAFAVGDGRALWKHDYPDPKRWTPGASGIAAADSGVAIILDSSVRFLTHSGAVAGEVSLDAFELAVHGDTVYARTSSGDDKPANATGSVLRAIDAARRSVKWQRQLASHAQLVHASATRLFVVSDNVLLALDAADGRERDRRGTGFGDVFLASPAPTFGTCDRGTLSWIDPATPLAQERGVVTGILACRNCTEDSRVELHVGDAHRTVPANGAFRMEVTGSGTLLVFAHDWGGRRQDLGRIELVGRGTYDLGKLTYSVWNGNE